MTSKTTRRNLLAAIPAATIAVAPVTATALSGLPTVPAGDPIFDAIEEHKAAVEAVAAFDDWDDWEGRGIPPALHRLNEALHSLFTVPPTTVVGVAAWLEYITEPEGTHDDPIVLAIGCEAVVPQFLTAASVLRGARS